MTLPPEELQAIDVAIDHLTLAPPAQEGAVRPHGEVPLFGDVVVAMDGSEGAKQALAWAHWLARHDGAHVHLVTALGPPPTTFDSGEAPPVYGSVTSWKGLMEEERQEADEVLKAAERSLGDVGVAVTSEIVIGSPASVISAIAEARGADLVICGAHDASAFERLVLGSVADGLKHHTHCSILIAKGTPSTKPVLLTTDGSMLSRRAARMGARLAQGLGAPARLIHVVPASGPGRAALAKSGYEEAAAARSGTTDTAAPANVEAEVAFGRPHEVISERANALDAQLIVMGSRGLGGLAGRVLGSVSNPVSHQAKASVLFIKPDEG